MDTNDITRVLTADPHTGPLFVGVYACDQLPLKISRPSLCVANTDPSTKGGMHWVSFYFPKSGPSEFFDSYGRKPTVWQHYAFLKRNSNQWVYNKQDLQALGSTVCGQYCVMYLLYRARGIAMSEFLSNFSKNDLAFNDNLVAKMFKSFARPNVNIQHFHHCTQCCRRRAC